MDITVFAIIAFYLLGLASAWLFCQMAHYGNHDD